MRNTSESLLQRLEALDSNLVSDVMDMGGLRNQVLSPSISSLESSSLLIGTAVCSKGLVLDGSNKPLSQVSIFDIDAVLFPGAVIVLENGGPATCATIGGFVARSWQTLGSTGMLTDGLVRDSGEIIDLGYPLFSSGTSPAFPQDRWVLVEVGGSVCLPARQEGETVTIKDGDLIIGDRDGVSIIPQERAEAIVTAAETLKYIEGRIARMMDNGKTRQEAFNENPRFDHVPSFVF